MGGGNPRNGFIIGKRTALFVSPTLTYAPQTAVGGPLGNELEWMEMILAQITDFAGFSMRVNPRGRGN